MSDDDSSDEIVRKTGLVQVNGTINRIDPWESDTITHFRVAINGTGEAFDFETRRDADAAADIIRVAYKAGRRDAFGELRRLIGVVIR